MAHVVATVVISRNKSINKCFVCDQQTFATSLILSDPKDITSATYDICTQCQSKSLGFIYIYEYMIQSQSVNVGHIDRFSRLLFEMVINETKRINTAREHIGIIELRKCLGHDVDIELRLNIINAIKSM